MKSILLLAINITAYQPDESISKKVLLYLLLAIVFCLTITTAFRYTQDKIYKKKQLYF